MRAFLRTGAGVWATIILFAFSAGFMTTLAAKRDQVAGAFHMRSAQP